MPQSSSSDHENEARLVGCWRLVRSDAAIDRGAGVEVEFHADGRLDYCIDAGDRWQIMRLTWRLDGEELLTDQASVPRLEITPWMVEPDGTLVLGVVGSRTWFRRDVRHAPAA
jgi:hypothetical protein